MNDELGVMNVEISSELKITSYKLLTILLLFNCIIFVNVLDGGEAQNKISTNAI